MEQERQPQEERENGLKIMMTSDLVSQSRNFS